MRLVLHAIRLPEGSFPSLLQMPSVQVRFPFPDDRYDRYEMSLRDSQREVSPIIGDNGRLRTEVIFNREHFRFSFVGAKLQDELHFRLQDMFKLHAWLLHADPKPPHCKAKCEDSGVEGFPCVECVKGDLVVRVCC